MDDFSYAGWLEYMDVEGGNDDIPAPAPIHDEPATASDERSPTTNPSSSTVAQRDPIELAEHNPLPGVSPAGELDEEIARVEDRISYNNQLLKELKRHRGISMLSKDDDEYLKRRVQSQQVQRRKKLSKAQDEILKCQTLQEKSSNTAPSNSTYEVQEYGVAGSKSAQLADKGASMIEGDHISMPPSSRAQEKISLNPLPIKYQCNRSPIIVCSEEEFLQDVQQFLVLKGHHRLVSPRG